MIKIQKEHFIRKEPRDVGLPEKSKRKLMKSKDRNYHKLLLVTRELGELCPSRAMKSDKSGESLQVKKAFVNFVRKARHTQIDWIADWQRYNDVEAAVRDQFDKRVFKRYNSYLGGEDLEPFFNLHKKITDAIYEKYGRVMAQYFTKTYYPNPEKLSHNYQYLYIASKIHLKSVPTLQHQHKEPWHNFEIITNIKFDHDWSKVKTGSPIGKSKSISLDICKIYVLVRDWKDPTKQKKKLSNADILKKLAALQLKGDIIYHLDFTKMTTGQLSTYYPRWKATHDKEQEALKKLSQ